MSNLSEPKSADINRNYLGPKRTNSRHGVSASWQLPTRLVMSQLEQNEFLTWKYLQISGIKLSWRGGAGYLSCRRYKKEQASSAGMMHILCSTCTLMWLTACKCLRYMIMMSRCPFSYWRSHALDCLLSISWSYDVLQVVLVTSSGLQNWGWYMLHVCNN